MQDGVQRVKDLVGFAVVPEEGFDIIRTTGFLPVRLGSIWQDARFNTSRKSVALVATVFSPSAGTSQRGIRSWSVWQVLGEKKPAAAP